MIYPPMAERTFLKEWRYKHNNPYHSRLAQFSHFIMRDHGAEQFAGRWNESVFGRKAPLQVEIGTGFGHFMSQYCLDHPEVNFVGIDYRFKRSFQLARRLHNNCPQGNFRFLRARGERLPFMFAPGEVDRVFYFFPDPWPKRRHHKKRLFRREFLEGVHRVLRVGGSLMVKTDHQGYADAMLEVIADQKLLSLELYSEDLYHQYPEHDLSRYNTKFEKIFVAKGIAIKALVLRKPLCP